MAAPALLFFPRFIPDILPPQDKGSSPFSRRSIDSGRKARGLITNTLLLFTPTRPGPPPPLTPLLLLTANKERPGRHPHPYKLPRVDQHAGSAGQKPHDDDNIILPLAHLPLPQGPVTTDANTPATSPARRLSAEEDGSQAHIEPCTARGPTTEETTCRHLALLHKSQQGHHSSPVRSPLLLGDLVFTPGLGTHSLLKVEASSFSLEIEREKFGHLPLFVHGS